MPKRKKVYQYDLSGNFIREWESLASASREYSDCNNIGGIKIYRKKEGFSCCHSFGFFWSYEKKKKIKTYDPDERHHYSIFQYDLEGNFIKEWNGTGEIEKELGFEPKRIIEVLCKRSLSSNGFRWTKEYKEKLDDYYSQHIFQYDIYGNFIKEWRNINEIMAWNPKITRTNIIGAINGKQKTCKNYQWSYKKVNNIGAVDLYKRKSTVYIYTNNITNEKYIGQTRTYVRARAGKDGKGYMHSTKFWNAIQKYGWENFSVEVIAKKLEQKDADILEQNLIEKYDSINNGYNTQTGGILSRVKK